MLTNCYKPHITRSLIGVGGGGRETIMVGVGGKQSCLSTFI